MPGGKDLILAVLAKERDPLVTLEWWEADRHVHAGKISREVRQWEQDGAFIPRSVLPRGVFTL